MLWIGNEVYGDNRGYEIAHVVEQGGKWMSVQHGGGYGQLLAFPFGKVEYGIAGHFITWGWSHQHIYSASFHPLPSPMLSKVPKQRVLGRELLLVGTMQPPYPFRMYSFLQPEDMINYLQWKARFVGSLPRDIRDSLVYRPYHRDLGFDQVGPIKKCAPSCRIAKEGNLQEMLAKARVVVIDHLSTVFPEAIVVRVPTILYWAPEWISLDPAVARIFEMLEEAEILFNSPEAAAAKVAAIWDDPLHWWESKTAREARQTFQEQHALTSKSWRREWIRFLRSEIRLMRRKHGHC